MRTGCCPHTAIRDDIAANLDAVEDLEARFGPLDLVLVESGGDNLTATFSQGLADLQIFVLDVSGGDKVPRKGGPGVTFSDLLVINKTDLAPLVGASLAVMARDARRGPRRAAGDLHVAARRPARGRGRRLGAGRRRQARRALANECAMTVPATASGLARPAAGSVPPALRQPPRRPVPRNRVTAAARIEAVAGPDGVTRLPVLASQVPLVLRRTPSAVYLVGGAAGPIGGD